MYASSSVEKVPGVLNVECQHKSNTHIIVIFYSLYIIVNSIVNMLSLLRSKKLPPKIFRFINFMGVI